MIYVEWFVVSTIALALATLKQQRVVERLAHSRSQAA